LIQAIIADRLHFTGTRRMAWYPAQITVRHRHKLLD